MRPLHLAVALSIAMLGGCATVSEVPTSSSGVDEAIVKLGKPSSDTDLLHFMEKGELLRRKGNEEEARETLLKADAVVRLWEDHARNPVGRVAETAGSLFLNDQVRTYEGRDYEKVLLSNRLTASHLAMGEWDKARTEVKKMHEREAIIAEFRAKDLEKAKAEAAEKGVKATSFREIDGYPVETLDHPEVNALKNSYESAYSNYIAGFVYEALGEGGLAAAGYRKAIEMRPGEPLLAAALDGLDARISRGGVKAGMVDTLFMVEAGTAPQLQSVQLPLLLPIPSSTTGINIIATPISWPTVGPVRPTESPRFVNVNDTQNINLALLTNLDIMIRKSIADEMPGIIARSSIRAITRGAAQQAIDDNSGQFGAFGSIISLVSKGAALALEQADVRSWRNVPGEYSVGRAALPVGKHKISITDSVGNLHTQEVDLKGRYAVVLLNVNRNEIRLASNGYGDNASIAEVKPQPVIAPEPLKGKKSKKVAKKSAQK